MPVGGVRIINLTQAQLAVSLARLTQSDLDVGQPQKAKKTNSPEKNEKSRAIRLFFQVLLEERRNDLLVTSRQKDQYTNQHE